MRGKGDVRGGREGWRGVRERGVKGDARGDAGVERVRRGCLFLRGTGEVIYLSPQAKRSRRRVEGFAVPARGAPRRRRGTFRGGSATNRRDRKRKTRGEKVAGMVAGMVVVLVVAVLNMLWCGVL